MNRSKNTESVLLKQQTSIFRLEKKKKKAFSHTTYEVSVFFIHSKEELFIFWSYLISAARSHVLLQCSHCSALTYLISGPHEISENTDS